MFKYHFRFCDFLIHRAILKGEEERRIQQLCLGARCVINRLHQDQDFNYTTSDTQNNTHISVACAAKGFPSRDTTRITRECTRDEDMRATTVVK